MKLWGRRIMAAVCAGLLTVLLAGSALAAETRKEIKQISLGINSNIEAGDDENDLQVVYDTSVGYDLTDVTIKNDKGEWLNGDKPLVEITLEADPDHYFGSMSKSKVKLYGTTGTKATYQSSSRKNDKSTLVITIQLNALKGGLDIENGEWDSEDTPIARWDSVAGAKKYEVRLFRGDKSVGSTETVTKEYFDFRKNITKEGEYSFKVRAVNGDSKGEWFESDSISVDEDMAKDFKNSDYHSSENENSDEPDSSSSSSKDSKTPSLDQSVSISTSKDNNTPSSSPSVSKEGEWKQNQIGWWYEYSDGTYLKDTWQEINNLWYCFDSSGYMRTGWILNNDGKWYYCNSSGEMLSNTTTPDGYQVDASGAMVGMPMAQ